MPSPRQQFGAWAEVAAVDFLRQKGYEILDRHVTSRYGEIDILARDGDTLVAVEVKARRNNKFGSAVEGITKKKFDRLRLAIEEYLQKKHWEKQAVRIDVVTIDRGQIALITGASLG